jgi:hypothetical protein
MSIKNDIELADFDNKNTCFNHNNINKLQSIQLLNDDYYTTKTAIDLESNSSLNTNISLNTDTDTDTINATKSPYHNNELYKSPYDSKKYPIMKKKRIEKASIRKSKKHSSKKHIKSSKKHVRKSKHIREKPVMIITNNYYINKDTTI